MRYHSSAGDIIMTAAHKESDMVRTVIGLEEEDKLWLDRQAEEEQVSMAELVRRAVRRYREARKREDRPLERLLKDTSGIWTGGDALAYQIEIRGEWGDR